MRLPFLSPITVEEGTPPCLCMPWGGKQAKLSEREGLRETLPSLGARRASCRRGPLSVLPTAASSDHLLVFPGTLPNPGTCPPPRMPKPLASASPCTGLQAGLASAPCPCHVEGRTSQADARPAGVCCRVGMGQPGLGTRHQWEEGLSTRLPGVHAAACKLMCDPLPGLCACLRPCPALRCVSARGCSMSSVLARPCWPPAPLAARAEPPSLVTACQTQEHESPRSGSVALALPSQGLGQPQLLSHPLAHSRA